MGGLICADDCDLREDEVYDLNSIDTENSFLLNICERDNIKLNSIFEFCDKALPKLYSFKGCQYDSIMLEDSILYRHFNFISGSFKLNRKNDEEMVKYLKEIVKCELSFTGVPDFIVKNLNLFSCYGTLQRIKYHSLLAEIETRLNLSKGKLITIYCYSEQERRELLVYLHMFNNKPLLEGIGAVYEKVRDASRGVQLAYVTYLKRACKLYVENYNLDNVLLFDII